MHVLAKPSQSEIEKFLQTQRNREFSYEAVGDTRAEVPAGFNQDCNRVLLGHGATVYQAACEALQQWKMFPAKWTEIWPQDAALQEGTVVAMLAHCFGKWWLNACRIVYAFDETNPSRRYGFAYGTLPGHVESGEERFMIEWDHDDQVWYEIFSFSRPRHWLVRLTYPIARWLQKRFVRQSLAQLRQIVSDEVSESHCLDGEPS